MFAMCANSLEHIESQNEDIIREVKGMSGGCFDHEQYTMARIADDIEMRVGTGSYCKATDCKFVKCIYELRKTLQMVNLIDHLLADDIDEEIFEHKWKDFFG